MTRSLQELPQPGGLFKVTHDGQRQHVTEVSRRMRSENTGSEGIGTALVNDPLPTECAKLLTLNGFWRKQERGKPYRIEGGTRIAPLISDSRRASAATF